MVVSRLLAGGIKWHTLIPFCLILYIILQVYIVRNITEHISMFKESNGGSK